MSGKHWIQTKFLGILVSLHACTCRDLRSGSTSRSLAAVTRCSIENSFAVEGKRANFERSLLLNVNEMKQLVKEFRLYSVKS